MQTNNSNNNSRKASRKGESGPVRIISPAVTPAAHPAAPEAANVDPLATFVFVAQKASGSGSGRATKAASEPIEWPAETVAAAGVIGFTLPVFYQERAGKTLPWRLAGCPADLETLSLPIPPVAAEGKPCVQLMGQIIHGLGGRLPSLADGQGLPLLAILRLFNNPTVNPIYQTQKAWRTLLPVSFNGKQPQNRITLLNRIAERSNRYCYCLDGILYLAQSAD